MGERAAWQVGHHQVTRSWVGGPCSPSRIGGAAAEARLAPAAEHPVVAAPPRIAGGVLLGVLQVGPHQGPCALDQRPEIGDVGHPRPRVDAADEQRLDLVEVADPGQVALVDESDPDLLVGMVAQPAERLVEVPVRTEDVGPEVADQPVLVGRGDDVDVVQAVADALPLVGGQHQADVVRRAAVPAGARSVDVPAAVHPEVGAQRPAVGEPDEQVLPAGHDLAHRGAAQVEGGQLRDAELAPAQRAAGQRGVHPLRGQPHGVSFGHASSVPGGRVDR